MTSSERFEYRLRIGILTAGSVGIFVGSLFVHGFDVAIMLIVSAVVGYWAKDVWLEYKLANAKQPVQRSNSNQLFNEECADIIQEMVDGRLSPDAAVEFICDLHDEFK